MSTRFHYPLANRSQRRRRLILNQCGVDCESSPSLDIQSSKPVVDLAANIPNLGALLSESKPITWLVLGDSLRPPSDFDQISTPGFVDVFREYLHGPLWRKEDQVINGTAPRFKVTESLEQLNFHLWRNKPDVIVVLCGSADAEGGVQGCEEFERALIALIRRIKQTGLNTIINTPPCLPETDDSLLVDRLVYLEALKASSAEENVPLIDHWKHWEWTAIEVGGTEAWYQPDRLHPGIRGFEQMTHLLLKECGLEPIQVN